MGSRERDILESAVHSICLDIRGPDLRLGSAYASEIGGCTYRPVRFALAERGKGLDEEPT